MNQVTVKMMMKRIRSRTWRGEVPKHKVDRGGIGCHPELVFIGESICGWFPWIASRLVVVVVAHVGTGSDWAGGSRRRAD